MKENRNEVIEKVWKEMLTWITDYTFESYCKVLDLISDFNDNNPEEQIEFYEIENGYGLEDNYVIVECQEVQMKENKRGKRYERVGKING